MSQMAGESKVASQVLIIQLGYGGNTLSRCRNYVAEGVESYKAGENGAGRAEFRGF